LRSTPGSGGAAAGQNFEIADRCPVTETPVFYKFLHGVQLVVAAFLETLLSLSLFHRFRIPPDNFDFRHDSFPAHQPVCDPALRSDDTSGAMEVPSADLHIRDLKLPMLRKGSTPSALTPATLQQRANVEKRDRDSRHPDASFVTIVTHQWLLSSTMSTRCDVH
jgi:hypothetical protein